MSGQAELGAGVWAWEQGVGLIKGAELQGGGEGGATKELNGTSG